MRTNRATAPVFPEEFCPLLSNSSDADEWVPCCSRTFYSLARSILEDESLAEDALQDSWPKVLRGISSFEGGPTACQWVSAIVANSARDIRRKLVRRREVSITEELCEDPAVDPATRAKDQQMLRVLREMVDRLPEPYRQVIEMRLERELSTSETAKRLDISRSNVTSRLHRGLRMLRIRFRARMRKTKRLS